MSLNAVTGSRENYSSYVLPVFAAILVHVLVAWVVTGGLDSLLPASKPEQRVNKVIKATLVSVKPEKKVKKSVRQKVVKKQAKPKVTPKAAPKAKTKPKSVDIPKIKEKAVPEVKPIDPRLLLEDQFAEEDEALQHDEEQEAVAAYSAQMIAMIEQNWSRPPSARNNMQVVLEIQLIPSGDVVSVNVKTGSGNAAMDRAAMLAVEKIGCFDFLQGMPTLLFEKNFRTMILKFNPQDLRL